MKYLVNDRLALMQPPEGPLAAYIRPFSDWVVAQGYRLDSLQQRVRIASDFSRWLGERALQAPDIRNQHCGEYLRYRGRRRKIIPGDAVALGQLRDYLRRQGVIVSERIALDSVTPVARCAQEFERYLREERLLAAPTIVNYVRFAAEFLKDRFRTGPVDLSELSAGDIISFVRRRAPRLHMKRAKLLTTALKSFLRYGCYLGEIRADLVNAVPIVANWSMPLIPRAISPDQVRRVLSHIDRRTVVGRRDYAILLLLARLGLRAGEIVSLELQDIDWKASSLSVRGKGGRCSQLPLTPGCRRCDRRVPATRASSQPLSTAILVRHGSAARVSRAKHGVHHRSSRAGACRSEGAHPWRPSVPSWTRERDVTPWRIAC